MKFFRERRAKRERERKKKTQRFTLLRLLLFLSPPPSNHPSLSPAAAPHTAAAQPGQQPQPHHGGQHAHQDGNGSELLAQNLDTRHPAPVLRGTADLDRHAHGLVAHVQDVDVARIRVAADVPRVEDLAPGRVWVGGGHPRREDGLRGKHRVLGGLRKGGGAGGRARVPGCVAGELLVGLQAEVVVAEGEAGVADVELGDAVERERGREFF